MTDDLGATAPKYQRIADVLRRQIKAGEYKPGDRLPSETTLMERFRDQFGTLSLPTLRQAIAVLRTEGLIESQQGIGTFVKTDQPLQRRSRKRYGRARADVPAGRRCGRPARPPRLGPPARPHCGDGA